MVSRERFIPLQHLGLTNIILYEWGWTSHLFIFCSWSKILLLASWQVGRNDHISPESGCLSIIELILKSYCLTAWRYKSHLFSLAFTSWEYYFALLVLCCCLLFSLFSNSWLFYICCVIFTWHCAIYENNKTINSVVSLHLCTKPS